MRFEHGFKSTLPVDMLFAAHRDGLPDFGPRLPGVRAIQAVSRKEKGTLKVLHHRWMGDPHALPGPLRFLVPARLFSWEDHSEWDESTRQGHWRVSVPALGDMVRIEGTHHFAEDGTRTAVKIEGELRFALIDAMGGGLGNRFLERLFQDLLSSSQDVIEGYVREMTKRA